MLDISRREILLSGAAASVAATAPARVFAQAAGAPSGTAGAAWDLRDIFPSDAAWETERQSLLAAIARLKAQKGTLARGPAAMRTALEAQSDANKRASRLFTYASLKADEDRRIGQLDLHYAHDTIHGTLILETDFETPEGMVTIVDCMPPREGRAPCRRADHAVVRRPRPLAQAPSPRPCPARRPARVPRPPRQGLDRGQGLHRSPLDALAVLPARLTWAAVPRAQ